MFFHPLLKDTQSFFMEQLLHRDLPIREFFLQFFIDKCIIKSNISSIFCGVGIIHLLGTSSIDRTQTHRTWFAAGIEFAVIELKRTEIFTRITDSDDLCMRCRIIRRSYLIPPSTYDLPVFDDNATKRSASIFFHIFQRQSNRFAHKFFSCHDE